MGEAQHARMADEVLPMLISSHPPIQSHPARLAQRSVVPGVEAS